MIQVNNEVFECHTKHTSYVFRQIPSGHIEHLYYGKRLNFQGHYDALLPKCEFIHGNVIAYDEAYPNTSLETLCLETSARGKGDIREPMIALRYFDGNCTSDFRYQSYEIKKKCPLHHLPSSYDEREETESLTLFFQDTTYQITLALTYSIFYDSDVIVRSATLHNHSQYPVTIERFLSCQLDFRKNPLTLTTFRGAWTREMKQYQTSASGGTIINDSKTGTSSNRANPFIMISPSTTSEDMGDCYGCNLIYSGNHFEALEPSEYGLTRLISGIQPLGFTYHLDPHDFFETPEAVLTYSHQGYGGISKQMHHFIKEHIVRGYWKKRVRPILINSWEASYFNFSQHQLLKLAKSASQVGIELFVLDDGWFGNRNDDTSSLGDWYVNPKKLPNGLSGLAKKINKLGMDFGIWVEPEMISINSDCYRKHPEYAVNSSGNNQSLGRHQLIIDLTQKEVQDYVIEKISNILDSANITYVKWDMNRIFSDCYSPNLSSAKQSEFSHRYMIGLYHVLAVLTKKYDHILFESCSSGGNRFDLGMLCYTPQIWASDNTDTSCRAQIQTGYSYGYPMSCIAAHVSDCPNHQTLRITPLESRFSIACFGLLGYECNLSDLNTEDLATIKAQIIWYKKYRKVLQYGDFYRLRYTNGIYQWIVVSKDQKIAIALYFQTRVISNYSDNHLVLKGLHPTTTYQLTNRPIKVNLNVFGDLVNQSSPIHIRKDSPMHQIICKIIKKESELENIIATGDILNHCGVQLKQAFIGTGYNEDVRLFQDYASRLYIIKEMELE